MGSVVPTAVAMNRDISWDAKPRILKKIHPRFGGKYYIHFQGGKESKASKRTQIFACLVYR
jgi:hypothetical protein